MKTQLKTLIAATALSAVFGLGASAVLAQQDTFVNGELIVTLPWHPLQAEAAMELKGADGKTMTIAKGEKIYVIRDGEMSKLKMTMR